MSRSRFSTWITRLLLMVCLLVNVVAVIPHHHHHHEICLADDFEHHDAEADSEQEETEQTCVTHFRAHTQVFQHLEDIPLHTTSIRDLLQRIGWCDLFLPCAFLAEKQAFFIPSFVPLEPSPYLKRRCGRAPPVIC